MNLLVIEKNGVQLNHVGNYQDPSPRDFCGRQNCFVCLSADKPVNGRCWKDGASYQIICLLCDKEGTQVSYFGETGYNCYQRGKQHLKALEGSQPDSPLYCHNQEIHPNIQMTARDWRMKVSGIHRRPLLRLCSEGVAISGAIEERDRGANMVILNSKKEFNQPGTISQKFGQLFN